MKTAIKGVEKASLTVKLLGKLLASGGNSNDELTDQSVDIKFTIGFLDTLNIGAVLVDESGQISGFNNSFVAISGKEELSGKTNHKSKDTITNKISKIYKHS